ncbi:MAG: mechanosensitive ion channel family protein [Ignavibacteria bacterium]|nr:mechanosensitive ion channel family protein [Ignavibacteria bacterium]
MKATILSLLLLLPLLFLPWEISAQVSPDSSGILKDAATGLMDTVTEAKPQWSFSMGRIIWSIIVLVIAYFAIKYFTKLLSAVAERWTQFRLTIKGFIPVSRILGWTIAFYTIIVEVLATPMATVVAFAASAGIAIGFASQDILKNIFGGITILFDRPFQVGDKIEIGEHYGEVVNIGLRTVRVQTPDDSLVSIPNAEIVSHSVSNANSGESNCQVVAEFFLPPDVDLVAARRIAYEAAAVSRYAYLNKPIAVTVRNEVHQGRSLMKMRLKAYVLDIRYEFAFSSEMTETVMGKLIALSLVSPEQLSLVRPPT